MSQRGRMKWVFQLEYDPTRYLTISFKQKATLPFLSHGRHTRADHYIEFLSGSTGFPAPKALPGRNDQVPPPTVSIMFLVISRTARLTHTN